MSRHGQAVSGKKSREQETVERASEDTAGEGRLYVVATPIGNLDDITLRALKVLAEADLVAAEDTRNTARLLTRHGIRARTLSLHEHNEASRAAQIIALLAEGRQVALVSDAGTPVLSDPGAVLVAQVREAGYPVVPIPGPSAAIAALSVAGLAGTAFYFAGFLPERSSARRSAIAGLSKLESVLIFYEAPHRVQDAVADLAAILEDGGTEPSAGAGGGRDIVIARELTKIFESVHRCPLSQASAWLAADANRARGEFVLLVTGAAPRGAGMNDAKLQEADGVLKALMAELPLAQSVKLACAITGLKRGELYPRALVLSGRKNSGKSG